MPSALLVIDMLEDFFVDGPLAAARARLTAAVNELIRKARRRNVPVIWVRQEFERDLSDAFLIMRKRTIPKTIKGTKGALILPELDRRPEDREVVKKRYSAFFRTDLDEQLRTLRVDTVVLAGINTHACVRTAAIDAYQRDLEVRIVRDCVLSPDEEHHRVSLEYLGDEISVVVDLDTFEFEEGPGPPSGTRDAGELRP